MRDRTPILEQYGHGAGRYDRNLDIQTRGPVLRRAINRLALQPGQMVLDVPCGTGVAFAAIERRIGTDGRLVGVDLSGEMLAIATARVRDAGWENIELIEAAAESLTLTEPVDAVLLFFSHDVIRSAAALQTIAGCLKPGGRLVAAGVMKPWPIARLAWPALRARLTRYAASTEGFEKPWSRLADVLDVATVDRPALYGGAMYVVEAVNAHPSEPSSTSRA